MFLSLEKSTKLLAMHSLDLLGREGQESRGRPFRAKTSFITMGMEEPESP